MEGRVRDNSQAIAAALVGAAVGAAAAYLLFTRDGRALRRKLEPALFDLARELDSFRDSFRKASNVASEGWRLLQETMSEGGPYPRQISPF
jgi:gas vesicle protein